jgi:hypothetical protein
MDRRPVVRVVYTAAKADARHVHFRSYRQAAIDWITSISRDGAIIFADLIGKLDILRVICGKCGRDGCYGLNRLINKRGRDAKVTDWLDELTAECPRKIAHNMNDRCDAHCPDLPKVL